MKFLLLTALSLCGGTSFATEIAPVQLLPKRLVCEKVRLIPRLTKYSVTGADLAKPEDLVAHSARARSRWTVYLSKESLDFVDESFLCDGVASYSFALDEILAAPGTKKKRVTGHYFYELRGEETAKDHACVASY